MKMDRQVRSSVRTQWVALGGALVVLAGLLVVWALSNAGARVQVVQLVRDVPAGQAIQADDLTVTGIAYDTDLQGLVPAVSLADVAGRVAAVDLQAGSLLLVGMWRDGSPLAPGEQRVGVVVRAGRAPADLGPGDTAIAASMDPADVTQVEVRVLDAADTAEGSRSFTLAAPAEGAVEVARLAANEQLVLVGAGSTVTPSGDGSAATASTVAPVATDQGIVEP
ncbi:MAG: SAF domain-containing protein [Ilumatobacteraceae bacterium]